MRFAGKTAVVTGAASGIGAATAARLTSEGARAIVVDIDRGRLDEVTARLNAEIPGCAQAVVGNVADEATWTMAADRAHSQYGPVDIVHSNAYLHVPGEPRTVEGAQWQKVIDVNLLSLYLAARVFADDLTAQRGSLIATSSVHALFGLRGYSAYAATKGAIVALCRQLAVEYAPNVRVNCVLPGPVATAAFDADDDDLRRTAAATVVGRLGRPEEIAAVVAFLASDDATFITGSSIVADGGWSITKDSL